MIAWVLWTGLVLALGELLVTLRLALAIRRAARLRHDEAGAILVDQLALDKALMVAILATYLASLRHDVPALVVVALVWACAGAPALLLVRWIRWQRRGDAE